MRFITIVAILTLALAIYMYCFPDNFIGGTTASSGKEGTPAPPASTSDAHSIIRVIGSALATAAVTAISWAYQTGSRRLGAVDVFGCEITAICRVSLIVDFAQKSVSLLSILSNKGKDWSSKFTSKEDYTPAYDSQLSDLQPLDINSVSSVTDFYTYRKAMADYLRRMAATSDPAQKLETVKEMIYIQFLMYESARYATKCLIEYQPTQTESLVIILCSELTLYTFLLHNVHDYRTKRLRLRLEDYNVVVPQLWRMLCANAAFDSWKKPQAVGQILAYRYNQLCDNLPGDCDPLPTLEA
jgi:hypothetical protein